MNKSTNQQTPALHRAGASVSKSANRRISEVANQQISKHLHCTAQVQVSANQQIGKSANLLDPLIPDSPIPDSLIPNLLIPDSPIPDSLIPDPLIPVSPISDSPLPPMQIRQARITDVPGIAALVGRFAGRGEILPRTIEDIYQSLREWVVAEREGEIVGCGALVILWADLAEIRSLVVAPEAQRLGIGRELVVALMDQAAGLEVPQVFALTRQTGFFLKLDFQVVPRESLPRKIWKDCITCTKFVGCDEVAVVQEVGKLEGRRNGRVEGRKAGRVEGWKDGRLEGWKHGRMEEWSRP
jgi:amino-acid N-acetyltransferase